jgi:hypothetical protein
MTVASFSLWGDPTIVRLFTECSHILSGIRNLVLRCDPGVRPLVQLLKHMPVLEQLDARTSTYVFPDRIHQAIKNTAVLCPSLRLVAVRPSFSVVQLHDILLHRRATTCSPHLAVVMGSPNGDFYYLHSVAQNTVVSLARDTTYDLFD